MINLKVLFKEFSIYSVSALLPQVVGFLSILIFTHYLSPEDYGVVNSISSFTAWFILLSSFGGESTLTRFFSLAENQESQRNYVSTWLLGIQVIILLGTGLMLLFSNHVSERLLGVESYAIYFNVLLISSILNSLINYMAQLLRYSFRAKAFSLLKIGQSFMIFGFTWTCLVMDLSTWSLIWPTLIGNVILLPIYFWLNRSLLQFKFSLAIFKEMIKFGLPLIPLLITWNALSMIDRVMLLQYSSAEAGTYSIAFKFASVLGVFNSIFGTTWSPRAYELYKANSPAETGKVFGQILHIYIWFFLVIAILSSTFLPEIASWLMPPSYIPAAVVFPFLIMVFIGDGSTYITQIPLSIVGKTVLMIYPPLFAAAINFVLNWLLIPQLGGLGAGIASALSYLVLGVLYTLLARQQIKIPVQLELILAVVLYYMSSLCITLCTEQLGLRLVVFVLTLIAYGLLIPREFKGENARLLFKQFTLSIKQRLSKTTHD